MVNTNVALAIVQLVALSLPAFAILLELMVESDFPYVNRAIPVVAASFGLVIASGVGVITLLMFELPALEMVVVLGILDLGLITLGIGASLIGLRMRQAQQDQAVDD